MDDQAGEHDESEEVPEKKEPKRLSDAFPPSVSLFRSLSVPPMPAVKLISDAFALNIKTQLTGLVAPQLNLFNQQVADLFKFEFKSPVSEIAESIHQHFRAQWEPIFEPLKQAVRGMFPGNWGDISLPSIDVLESILIDEGIPLIWVPGPRVVEALFKAETASDRRRIVSQRWKGIISDCEAVLEDVEHFGLTDARGFALDCVHALRNGHTNAAQALAANLLDSVLHSHFDKASRIKLTRNDFKQNGTKFNLDDYKLRVAFTFAPVWCAHAKFWPDAGDPIPRSYGRHPSAHAVSRAQYTRINAVIGLMLVTSLIKFFDVELARRD